MLFRTSSFASMIIAAHYAYPNPPIRCVLMTPFPSPHSLFPFRVELPQELVEEILYVSLTTKQNTIAQKTPFLPLPFFIAFTMASNGVTSNSAMISAKAPDLGAFPLDHFRECKTEIEHYYVCLKANEYMAPMCRDEVREYLECRMERGLMKKADVRGFGLPETEFVPTKQHRVDLKEQWLRQKMNQVTAVWEENYKRADLHIPDGYERDKNGATQA